MLKFYKYHGTGNDFIIIDNFSGEIDDLSEETIKHLCNRRFGIGADGLIILKKPRNKYGTGYSDYDFEMDYYNADGSGATMCGNGGRCIVAFAHKIGIIKDKAEFIASDGVHQAVIHKSGIVALKMNDVDAVNRVGDDYTCYTGSPHFISFVDDLEKTDVYKEGQKIRYSDKYIDAGINVNFVEPVNAATINIRTYERGVEDETLSCGTGSVASALIFAELNNEKTGEYTINVKGGTLKVCFEKKEEKFINIWLSGPATFVFEGKVNPDDIRIVHPFVKGMKEDKTEIIPEYRRNLPHFQPKDGVFFITFRLHGTLPKHITESIKDNYEVEIAKCKNQNEKNEVHKEYFEEYDSLLDSFELSGNLLKEDKNAEIVKEAIHYRDGKDYTLICYTIMLNHVHLIFYKAQKQVFRILGSLKRHTSRQINLLNDTTGTKVWQKESYDNLIKNRNELATKIKFTVNNPVKAGLVNNWKDWKYTYCKKEFLEE
ncbi:MAG: diaminopimelate epimerase [Bacteroidales bacterium]|nr:diaminopimelate epimerase [Bacteroidales bacterium]